MDEKIISYAAGITSVVAIFISIYNTLTERKRLITETITKNRIEWIKEVRSLLICYASAYSSSDSSKLKETQIHILLYINAINGAYNNLIEAMDACACDKEFSQGHYNDLILASQKVLSDVWTRMKREAGYSKKTEGKFLKSLRVEIGLDEQK